uniref:Uncharacterized protein n=1 Tax=Triticum urartu TaxID=4572 RepID=A0A8R7UWM0_TRIUA
MGTCFYSRAVTCYICSAVGVRGPCRYSTSSTPICSLVGVQRAFAAAAAELCDSGGEGSTAGWGGDLERRVAAWCWHSTLSTAKKEGPLFSACGWRTRAARGARHGGAHARRCRCCSAGQGEAAAALLSGAPRRAGGRHQALRTTVRRQDPRQPGAGAAGARGGGTRGSGARGRDRCGVRPAALASDAAHRPPIDSFRSTLLEEAGESLVPAPAAANGSGILRWHGRRRARQRSIGRWRAARHKSSWGRRRRRTEGRAHRRRPSPSPVVEQE